MHSFRIPRPFLTPAIAVSAAMTTGCTTLTDLRSDYDRKSDFGNYSTYNFIDGYDLDAEGYAGLFTQYMTEAIAIEMEKRGYIRSSDPDLLVDPNAVLQEKTRVRRQAASTSNHHGYRDGRHDPWSRYGYATQPRAMTYTYTEGTFNIDIIDARKRRLVWTAAATGRVPQQDVANLGQSVRDGVPKFFSSYLFMAGDPNPVTRQ